MIEIRRERILVRCLLAASLAIACSSTNPTGPSDVTQQLGVDVPSSLRVGLSVKLSAYALRGGQREQMTAVWTSSDPRVAEVVANDSLAAIAPGRTTIEARLQAETLRRDLSVVPDVRGSWSGEFRITACDRESGDASSPCRFLLGSVHPITVTIDHSGEALSGSMKAYQTMQPGTIDGTIDYRGNIVLTGMIQPVDYQGEDILQRWQTTFAEGELTASAISVRSTFVNSFGKQVLIETWEVKALKR